jgi:hypothetical protein
VTKRLGRLVTGAGAVAEWRAAMAVWEEKLRSLQPPSNAAADADGDEVYFAGEDGIQVGVRRALCLDRVCRGAA